jgi:hypothetical protein
MGRLSFIFLFYICESLGSFACGGFECKKTTSTTTGKYAPEKCTFRSARDYMRRPSSFMLNGNGGNASTKNKRGAKAPRKPAPGDYQVLLF